MDSSTIKWGIGLLISAIGAVLHYVYHELAVLIFSLFIGIAIIIWGIFDNSKEKRLQQHLENAMSYNNKEMWDEGLSECQKIYSSPIDSREYRELIANAQLTEAVIRISRSNTTQNEENELNIALITIDIALKTFTREKFPLQFAILNKLKGNVYAGLSKIRDIGYLEQALQHYNIALTNLDKTQNKLEYAILLDNISICLLIAPYKHNILRAESYYLESFKLYDEVRMTKLSKTEKNRLKNSYPRTLMNMGLNYSHLAAIYPEDKALYLHESIFILNSVFEHINIRENPDGYAVVLSNLGGIYCLLANEPNENLIPLINNAINAINQALRIQTKENSPRNYATNHYNLGAAYLCLAKYDEKETSSHLKKSLYSHKECLRIFTLRDYPLNFAQAHNTLAIAYLLLGDQPGNDKIENTRKALESFEESLIIYNKEKYPNEYNMIEKHIQQASNLIEKFRKEAGN